MNQLEITEGMKFDKGFIPPNFLIEISGMVVI